MRDIQKEIQENLDEIENKCHVKILMAVESGSRSWGFASPDSDYDVRFIYMHAPEDYLRIDPIRDVIEWKLDEVLDINGWDLKKALLAFGKGNPNVMGWAASPIISRDRNLEKTEKNGTELLLRESCPVPVLRAREQNAAWLSDRRQDPL